MHTEGPAGSVEPKIPDTIKRPDETVSPETGKSYVDKLMQGVRDQLASLKGELTSQDSLAVPFRHEEVNNDTNNSAQIYMRMPLLYKNGTQRKTEKPTQPKEPNKPGSNPGSGTPGNTPPNTVPGSDIGAATGTGPLTGGEVSGGSFGPTTPLDSVPGAVVPTSSGGF